MAFTRRLLPAATTPVLTDVIPALVGGLDADVQVVKWVMGAQGLIVPVVPGSQASTTSLPAALSTEDRALLTAISGKLDSLTDVHDVTSSTIKALLSNVLGEPLAVDNTVRIEGNTPEGDPDSAPFPLYMGATVVAHGANPTAHAAGARKGLIANRHGAPFVIGGHPNVISKAHIITDANGAQLDLALVAIATGLKIVVTRLSVVADNANTGDTAVNIGFGLTTTPVADLDGTVGVLVNGSFDGGAGITLGDGSGIIGVGGDGEDLRMTCADPVGGNLRVSYSYYTIES